jgi:hypothetical protein
MNLHSKATREQMPCQSFSLVGKKCIPCCRQDNKLNRLWSVGVRPIGRTSVQHQQVVIGNKSAHDGGVRVGQ